MPQKNRYLRHARVNEAKLRQVLRCFCADLTAAQTTELCGLNRKTVLRLCTLFRRRIALLATDECPFAGEVEVDESYFGAHRVRGRRGRGAGRKTPVFGILERGGRVHTQIVRNCSKATLQAIILGKIIPPQASIPTPGPGTTGWSRPASPGIIASAITTTASPSRACTSTASRASGASPSVQVQRRPLRELPALPQGDRVPLQQPLARPLSAHATVHKRTPARQLIWTRPFGISSSSVLLDGLSQQPRHQAPHWPN